ncbi:MAG: rhomboid family intramembrane serine protease [bacterium]|nr:rhomboid family intramembrane serine protease [bacterium]
MRIIRYNAPVTLTLTIAAVIVLALDMATGHAVAPRFFSSPPSISPGSLLWYPRLVTHVLGHADWAHLAGNGTFLLLLGPIVEERYGSGRLLVMIVITAIVTAILNAMLSPSSILGASGVVFLLIVLSSFGGQRGEGIPLTFVLVAILFLGREVVAAFHDDNISQLAHLVGGACGAVFGFGAAAARSSAGHS